MSLTLLHKWINNLVSSLTFTHGIFSVYKCSVYGKTEWGNKVCNTWNSSLALGLGWILFQVEDWLITCSLHFFSLNFSFMTEHHCDVWIAFLSLMLKSHLIEGFLGVSPIGKNWGRGIYLQIIWASSVYI